MVFADLPLTQEFKTLGMDDYLGASPLQPQRIGEAQGTGANQSSSKVLVEDYQDGGDQS